MFVEPLKRICFLAALLAGIFVFSSDASAQVYEEYDGPPPPPPPDAPLPPHYAPPLPPGYYVEDDYLDTVRARVGANVGLMAFIPGVSWGANSSFRGGVAIKRYIAAYAEFGSGFGLGASVTPRGNFNVGVAWFWRLAAMAEFNLGGFFVGLGPALFKGAWVAASKEVGYWAGGYCPAVNMRLGYGFGHRNRFTLGLEGMLVFAKVYEVAWDRGKRIGDSAIGFAPALTFGWDLK